MPREPVKSLAPSRTGHTNVYGIANWCQQRIQDGPRASGVCNTLRLPASPISETPRSMVCPVTGLDAGGSKLCRKVLVTVPGLA